MQEIDDGIGNDLLMRFQQVRETTKDVRQKRHDLTK